MRNKEKSGCGSVPWSSMGKVGTGNLTEVNCVDYKMFCSSDFED